MNETHSEQESEQIAVNQKTCNILKEFLENLFVPFPEVKENLHQGLIDILENKIDTPHCLEVLEHCKSVFPPRFFDILYQKEEIFEEPCEFLPSIDFSFLFKQNISDSTKETLWKYLQLILFSFVNDSEDASFGDASKLFEEINQDEFKEKLEETIKEMENMFDASGENMNSNINLEDLPDAEEMHEHISGLLDGKLGKLAREIAEEAAGEMNLQDSDNVQEAFQGLLKNPGKLMNLVKTIGTKMDDKLKSGNMNQEELFKEANDLMGKMSSMPGMGNIQEMMSKMGGAGGLGNIQEMMSKMGMGGGFPNLNKRNMAQAASMMQQNARTTGTKDRLRRKLEQRQQQAQLLQLESGHTPVSPVNTSQQKQELKWTPNPNETIEKTSRNQQGVDSQKKKKKKKKKGNNKK